jgi:hypothetical protein
MVGGITVGCADAGETTHTRSASNTRSAKELLNEANRTMKALTSVTVVKSAGSSSAQSMSGRLVTDLKRRCTFKAAWSSGARLEQVRIGETDYIRGNDVYFVLWGRETVPAMRKKSWLKSPVSAAKGADELADCAWPFSSFGKATKGKPTEVDGRPVIPIKVRDGEAGRASYTFYVAAEGDPYILKVVYEVSGLHFTREFSDFNKPLSIRPPAADDVLDLSSLPSAGSSP